MQKLAPHLQHILDESNADFGLSILHLESGDEVNINAESSFPMASVLKIPVLCEAFRQIDAGVFTVEDRWELTHAEKNIGSGVLTYLRDSLQPTVYDLLLLMIIVSDNTATDMVMNRVGVENVDSYMKSLGLGSIHMPSNIRGIFERLLGAEGADPGRLLADLATEKPTIEPLPNSSAYSSGPENNVGTPNDMTRLLAMIYRGEIVGRSSCDEILHIMLQQQLNQRLPRFLPSKVPFAHKTGTLAGVRNDAGILYASPGAHLAITLFCRWDTKAVEDNLVAEREREHQLDSVFGHITKSLYDHFMA